ncbi:STM3941 family protein [Anaerotignum sp.]
MEEKIIIRKKVLDKRSLKLIPGSVLFCIPLLWFLWYFWKDMGDFAWRALPLYLLLLLFSTLAVLCIIVILWFAITIIRGATKGEIALLADAEGVHSYLGTMSVEFIPWKAVERIYLNCIDDSWFIEFVFQDENKYLRNFSKRQKREMRMEKEKGHQLVYLPLEKLGEDPEVLFSKMEKIFEKVRQK